MSIDMQKQSRVTAHAKTLQGAEQNGESQRRLPTCVRWKCKRQCELLLGILTHFFDVNLHEVLIRIVCPRNVLRECSYVFPDRVDFAVACA